MLLAIDIGNTNISFGVFQGNKIIKRFNILTKAYRLKGLKRKLSRVSITDAIICSVVPASSKVLRKDLEKLLGNQPYIIGKGIKVPIKNLYRKPWQVGQDRLVNAYAGVMFYGSPLIVVDFGTAITFDVISKNREYLGGMILPGLEMSLSALAEKTALLPKIRLERPWELIGGDTRNSMLSGIVYGFAGLTDNLLEKIKSKIGKNARVIGTGGNINLIGRYCKRMDRIDRDLTLKGLYLIYNHRIL
jgi:type III pantothenate kinase